MSLEQKSESEEEKLLRSFHLMLLYISGADEHSPYLANPFPKRPKSRGWQSKETFVDLHCWTRLNFEVLDQLEDLGLLEQPQKGKGKQRSYVSLNKRGMRHARNLLKNITVEGTKEALAAKSRHEEYINYETPIDLAEAEFELE
jgi:hypothetical protein